MIKNKVFKSSAIYFTSAFLFLLIKLFSSLNLLSWMGSAGNLIVNAFIQIGLMFLLPMCLYTFLNKKGEVSIKQTFKDFQFSRINWQTVLLSFALGFCMFIGVIILSTSCASFWNMLGYRNPSLPSNPVAPDINFWTGLIIPVITTAILPGFCEEFANRGLLLNGLNSQMSPRKAIFFSALCFGLLHYNINQAIYAFVIGLVVGTIAYYSKSIWPAVIIHFTNNFCSTYFSWAYYSGSFGKNFYPAMDQIFAGSFIGVFLKLLLITILVVTSVSFLMSEIYKHTRKNRLYERLQKIATIYLGEGEESQDGVAYNSDNIVDEHHLKQNYDGEVFVKMQETVYSEIVEDHMSKTLLEKFVPKILPEKIPQRFQNIFLWTTIFMTGLLTLFTLVWGFL